MTLLLALTLAASAQDDWPEDPQDPWPQEDPWPDDDPWPAPADDPTPVPWTEMPADDTNVVVSCGRALGLASGVTPGGRDWDFTTPGPYAISASPLFTQTCMRQGRHRNGAAWIGLDVLPWYQHSYARLDVRAPLLVLMNWGIGWQLGDNGTIGPQLVSNGIAWGLGVRYTAAWGRKAGLAPGLDLRVNVLPGTEPDFQVVLATRFHAMDLPQDPDVLDAKQVTFPQWRVVAGFEMGTVVAVRAELVNEQNWAIALRLGENTAFRRDVGLQPIGLASIGIPFGAMRLTGSAGTTRYDGDWVPVIGVALLVGEPTDTGRLQIGILTDARGGDDRYQSPDVSVGFVW